MGKNRKIKLRIVKKVCKIQLGVEVMYNSTVQNKN